MSDYKFCPYPGLRPFTEGESIYFKGREDHIKKIITQLEDKKFIMLTGASGDGKSSLVYAGLIPNARAGFFKAKFNNWLVVDFRPERQPLHNFSKALTKQMNLHENNLIEKDLKFGYSSLVRLYKSTPYYLDYNSEVWQKADDTERKKLKRKAANLLIVVDQFEEFFTNKENYTNGIPSLHSQTIVNLLLETTKIAIAENLPIYIICTMRSDYIGNCAVFRGLPEFIGYSQFFVPRLIRKELVQVIEEPAILSGTKVSKRLSEIIINELNEGIDQLPVLQHTLNQIWKLATIDNSEMDLLHFAMLGGISGNSLEENDRIKFEEWFKQIPEYKKSFFLTPSLSNVLNAHADELYETAAANCNKFFNTEISDEDSKFIIETTFKCLTKIDESRAVRNRMTLEEITSIIKNPKINNEFVSNVLTLFRIEGNTFIRPFITGNKSTQMLLPESILDITHESLIRNWKRLKQWTDEENENVDTYLDFKVQMQRWLQNNKSKNYLLPAGTLAFFESWYNSISINKYWLIKYDSRELSINEKSIQAEQTIKDIKEFIKSSRKSIIRKRNILITTAIVIILILTGFTVWAFIERGKALNQQIIAQQQSIEANKAKESALKSELIAIASKDTANRAKEEALKSQYEAFKQKNIAILEAGKALEQSIYAQKQSDIAKEEATKAEELRKISEIERLKAINAENRAKQLTLISVAQNMALKSSINDNPQLKGILAMQAFRFTKENDGLTQDPVIYEALKSAYAILSPNQSLNVLKGASDEARSMFINNKNSILLSVGKDGAINKWDLNSGKIVGLSYLKYKIPICFINISEDGKYFITGHDNNLVCLWNPVSESQTAVKELKGHNGPIRTAVFSPNGRFVATAGKDSLIFIWDINSESTLAVKKVIVKSNIKAIVYSPDGNNLIAAAENGEIYNITVESLKIQTLYKGTSIPISLCIINNSNKLAAGFSDGKVRIFNLKSPSLFTELSDNNTGIEIITTNNNGTLLASAGADKVIRIYDLQYLTRKPIVIKDNKSKVRCLIFNNADKLIGSCEDKTIRIWETSSEKIAGTLCSLLIRNLTQEEWKQFVGEQIPYSKTCNIP